jgi:hypothetical protein
MGPSEPLLSSLGVIAVAVAMLLDSRRAVPLAATVVALGLAPSAATAAGGAGVLVLLAAATAAWLFAWIGGIAGRRLPGVRGLDPRVPAFAPARQLFGPRSQRALAAALAVPVASWIGFYVPVGEVAALQGLLFPAAYAWCCGALRFVLARTLSDLAVGTVMIGVGGATGWLIRTGPDAITGAAAVAALAPLAALVAGWLAGRRARRPAVAQGEAAA